MAKQVRVTDAQREAARAMVARSEAAGKPVPPAVRKIADAKTSPAPTAAAGSAKKSRAGKRENTSVNLGPLTSKRSSAATNNAARMTRRSGTR